MPIIDSKSDAKFDALIRTNKANSLMSFIMATNNIPKNSLDRKEEIAKRLKSSYELFRENVKGYDSGAGSYGNGVQDIQNQFESHYTMGYEMGIWEDSDFKLNPIAQKVANYEITVKEYIGIVFTNLFTYYNVNAIPQYHHFLFEILNRYKLDNLNSNIIPKSLIVNSLPIEEKMAQGNLLFNYLVATNFFELADKDSLRFTKKWENKVDELISLCNLKYQNLPKDEAITLAKDKKLYANYVTSSSLFDNSHSFNTNNNDNASLSKNEGCNVLLYGVPGSGKSWTIEHEYCSKNSIKERLVFHPDYTYSDFIGQILPSVDDNGQVSYKFTPGPFTNILKKAVNDPQHEYVLIIEEINRGNAPAIFGEVFQLLDRKVDDFSNEKNNVKIGESEYGITNPDIAKIVYNDPNQEVRIPSNLSIIGTMNTSDQNVFTLDTAFQRRWNMRLVENNFENVDPSFANASILDTHISWQTFCTTINNIIVENNSNQNMTSSEDKRLGTYFVHGSDLIGDYINFEEYNELCQKEAQHNINEEEKQRINTIRQNIRQNRKFPEKVIKYLWDDAFKFNRELIFDKSKYKSLEQVIKAFIYSRGSERFNIFKEDIKDSLLNCRQDKSAEE